MSAYARQIREYAPKPGTHSEIAYLCVKNAGRAIRSPEIAEHTGLTIAQVGSALDAAVMHGLVTMCKVKHANGAHMNEYRVGSGLPLASHGELKPAKRADPPLRRPVGSVPPAPLLTQQIAQPEVAHNTGIDASVSRVDTAPPPAEGIDVAPKPQAKPPKPNRKAAETAKPAGNDKKRISLVIDSDGTVSLTVPGTTINLSPMQSSALGEFMTATERLWKK
jgi:hypothetical protein